MADTEHFGYCKSQTGTEEFLDSNDTAGHCRHLGSIRSTSSGSCTPRIQALIDRIRSSLSSSGLGNFAHIQDRFHQLVET